MYVHNANYTYAVLTHLLTWIFIAQGNLDTVHLKGPVIDGAKRIIYKYVEKTADVGTNTKAQPENKITVYTYFDAKEASMDFHVFYPFSSFSNTF